MIRAELFFVALGDDFVRRRYYRPAVLDFLPVTGMALVYGGLTLKVKDLCCWDGDSEVLYIPIDPDDRQQIISGVAAGQLADDWQSIEA